MKKTIVRLFMSVIIVFLFLVVAIMGVLYSQQERLIFFPEKLPPETAFTFQTSFTERWFEVEKGIQIHSLHFKVDSPKGLVLYFHGNAGSLRSWGDVSEDFTTLNYDVVVIDYRGYGKSQGTISNENDLHQDALSIYKELENEYKQIILYGRSIGTGIASKLATQSEPSLLILETPYYSLPDLVGHIYPILPSWLLRYQLDNATQIKQLSIPVHLIHGSKDELIPYTSSVRLEQIGPHISLHTIDEGHHNTLPTFKEYHRVISDIIP